MNMKHQINLENLTCFLGVDGSELLRVSLVRSGLLRGGLGVNELFDLLTGVLTWEFSLHSLPSFLDLAST